MRADAGGDFELLRNRRYATARPQCRHARNAAMPAMVAMNAAASAVVTHGAVGGIGVFRSEARGSSGSRCMPRKAPVGGANYCK